MANLKSGTSIGGVLALFDGISSPTFTNIVNVVGSPSNSTPTDILLLGRDYNPGVAYASVASLVLSNNISNTRLDIKLLYANNSSIVTPDTTVMTLLSSGKVGIGTAAPIRPLHINGELSLSNNGGGCYLNVHDTAGNAGVNLQIRGLSTGGTAEAACSVAITGTLSTTSTVTATGGNSGNWNTAYTHSQANSQSHTDYLINNGDDTTSGALSAGNTNTAGFITSYYAKAAIRGNWPASSYWGFGSSNNANHIKLDSCDLVGTWNAAGCIFDVIGAITASTTITATSTMTASNFILSSDKKLKINILPLKNSSVNIEYKEFELISEPGQKRYGVIAQDLQKTNPELIRKGEDGMLSVAYFDLLILEINSLKERVKELERRIK